MVQKARKLMEDDKLSAEEAARVLKVSRRTLFGGWPQRGSMMRWSRGLPRACTRCRANDTRHRSRYHQSLRSTSHDTGMDGRFSIALAETNMDKASMLMLL
jgi:hypothetical protein